MTSWGAGSRDARKRPRVNPPASAPAQTRPKGTGVTSARLLVHGKAAVAKRVAAGKAPGVDRGLAETGQSRIADGEKEI